MPIGTTSNFLRSIALRTEAAESSETSCSPLRPPKRMPTRSFLAIVLIVAQQEAPGGERDGSECSRQPSPISRQLIVGETNGSHYARPVEIKLRADG